MSDLDVINAADAARQSALATAASALRTLQQASPEMPDENDRAVQAVKRQLYTAMDSNFWPAVGQALTAIESNQGYTGRVTFQPDRAYTGYAHVDPSCDYSKGERRGEEGGVGAACGADAVLGGLAAGCAVEASKSARADGCGSVSGQARPARTPSPRRLAWPPRQSIAPDEVLDHLAGGVVAVLRRRALHEVGRGAG